MSLRAAWDRAAEDWIRWARAPGHDHWFWQLTLPAVLELSPPPGRLTVDLACGEGRLARELIARGHRVVGVEASPRLAEAARESGVDVRVADATAVPLDTGAVDLLVASMALLNMDDLDGVVAEVARVLAPGGWFVFAIPHPAISAKALGDDPRAGDYFAEYEYCETRERGGLRMTFHDRHRPLEAYARALERAGLVIHALREPHLPGAVRPQVLVVGARHQVARP